jgi:large subunit ribosomal protein L24
MDIRIPAYMLANEQEPDKRPVRSIEQPVPFSWIRLVTPLKNAETGLLEDVICEKVETTKPWFDKHTGHKGIKACYRRFIAMSDGTKIFIPYPGSSPKERKAREDAKEEETKDTSADTLRLEVEQKTFVPTLLRPPMPGSVIDELRNKYSIFRTRHDPEYIAKKMKEDEEKEEKKKLIAKMRTPIKEINRLEKKMRKAKGKGKLTEDMLESIGKVIMEKRQVQFDVAAKLNGERPVVVA